MQTRFHSEIHQIINRFHPILSIQKLLYYDPINRKNYYHYEN